MLDDVVALAVVDSSCCLLLLVLDLVVGACYCWVLIVIVGLDLVADSC